jgi:hypothetical protein
MHCHWFGFFIRMLNIDFSTLFTYLNTAISTADSLVEVVIPILEYGSWGIHSNPADSAVFWCWNCWIESTARFSWATRSLFSDGCCLQVIHHNYVHWLRLFVESSVKTFCNSVFWTTHYNMTIGLAMNNGKFYSFHPICMLYIYENSRADKAI